MKLPLDKLIARLREKKKSYQSLFGPKGLLESEAMMDLAWFCYAFRTTKEPGTDMLINEGRRQVWMRIQEYLNLEPDEIVQLYGAAIRKGDN